MKPRESEMTDKDKSWRELVRHWKSLADTYRRQIYAEQCMRRAAEQKLTDILKTFEVTEAPTDEKPLH